MVEIMAELYLTRKEFLALPVEERRKILEKSVNDKAMLGYYKIIEDTKYMSNSSDASNSCEDMYLD